MRSQLGSFATGFVSITIAFTGRNLFVTGLPVCGQQKKAIIAATHRVPLLHKQTPSHNHSTACCSTKPPYGVPVVDHAVGWNGQPTAVHLAISTLGLVVILRGGGTPRHSSEQRSPPVPPFLPPGRVDDRRCLIGPTRIVSRSENDSLLLPYSLSAYYCRIELTHFTIACRSPLRRGLRTRFLVVWSDYCTLVGRSMGERFRFVGDDHQRFNPGGKEGKVDPSIL